MNLASPVLAGRSNNRNLNGEIQTTFCYNVFVRQLTFVKVNSQIYQLLYHIKSHKDKTFMLYKVRFDNFLREQIKIRLPNSQAK